MTDFDRSDFSSDTYCALIDAFRIRGYHICGFEDARPDARDLVLRHDVDMTIEAARDLARLEKQIGVTSAYFVLLRSELYNPQTPENTEMLSEILSLGHTIGLHFDAALYPDNAKLLDTAAARECETLETLLGREVQTISFHRPRKSLVPYNGTLAGRLQTYAPKFFSEIGYCSDSRGEWGRGHPLDHAHIATGKAVQLLTHPIWWMLSGANREDKLRAFVAAKFSSIEHNLSEHCEPYRYLLNRK
jgi:hypothetical protein